MYIFVYMCTYMYRLKTILYMECQWMSYFCEIVCPYPMPRETNLLSFFCRESQIFKKSTFNCTSRLSALLLHLNFCPAYGASATCSSPQFRKLFQSSSFLRFSGNYHFNNSLQKLFSSLLVILFQLSKNTGKCYKLKRPSRKENKGTGYKIAYFQAEDCH